MNCPKCGSENVIIQREQTASFGAGTNKAVIEKKKKRRGCFYWLFFGWFFDIVYWLFFGLWKNLLFGRKKGGLNFKAEKTFNKTVAVCQDCGHHWKVK